MIKESSEDSANENPKITNNNEQKPLSSSSKEIKKLSSKFKQLNLNSELSKSPKKSTSIVYNEINKKSNLELEDNSNKNIEKIGKEIIHISPLDEKIINNNKKINTPLKLQSSPGNFKLKPNANFQMKSRKNTYTESDFNLSHFNQINLKSPIYSYFDQSQKFLSENYNGDGYIKLSENKIIKKSSEQEDNISKNIISEENPETPSMIPNKAEKSIEHDSESMNYNDLNLFMSPSAHNSSHVSGGLNNLHTNKISRKSSQATVSNNRGNSQNKIINSIGPGENENIDFNLDIPLNESNDDININNNEIKLNKDSLNNIQVDENTNFLLNNLGNPWLNINNSNLDNINDNYMNKNIQQKIMNNNNLGSINNNIPINNMNNRNINFLKNSNQINNNNNNDLYNLIQNLNSLNNINNMNNSNEINELKKLLILKYLNSQNQNRISLPIQNNFKNIPLQYNLKNNFQNIQNNNLQNLQNIRDIQTIQNLLNLKRIQDMKNQQTQNIQNLQNIHNKHKIFKIFRIFIILIIN